MSRTTVNAGIVVVVCLVLALLYFQTFHTSVKETYVEVKSQGPPVEQLKAMLDFIPNKLGYICEDLFKDTPASGYNMTPAFYRYLGEHKAVAAAHGKMPVEEYRALHYIMGRKFVKYVCETGFNAGFSSFYALTASEQTVVHSFELGGDLYRKQAADWLTSIFSTRFSIHLGDSTVMVPKFSKENPDFRCDYMYVDGGHVYSVAKADMVNFANIANLKNNFIAFDDYPPGFDNPNFGQAWEESVKEGFVKELTRCAYKDFGGVRGVVVGVVVKHPNGSKK